MNYKLKFSLLFLFPCFLFSQNNIDFGSVDEKSKSTKSINYDSKNYSRGSGDSIFTYFNLMGNDYAQAALTMPLFFGSKDGGDGQVNIAFEPKQNISHNGIVLVESEYNVEEIITIEGQGMFSNMYYSTTRNKSEEALKTALKDLLSKNAVSLGYNTARDNMYASIDNVGGQVECVYTGKKATFNTRAGANSASFNCEHTYPQGFFNSQNPQKSDIHHLFPTTVTSNSRRGNNPFGNVTNTSWQDGGSKSGGGFFEPRDVHKGAVARSMIYFVLRYEDYLDNGKPFLSLQESTLRSWHKTYSVSVKETDRNNAIFLLQKNRSPLVDYPQLLDRITKVSGNSIPIEKQELKLSRNLRDIQYRDTLNTINLENKFTAVVYNSGNSDVKIENIGGNDVEVDYDATKSTLAAGDYLVFDYWFTGFEVEGVSQFDRTLTVKTNITGSETMNFTYTGYFDNPLTNVKENTLNSIKIFPNPTTDNLSFEGIDGISDNLMLILYNKQGQRVKVEYLNSINKINVRDLPLDNYTAILHYKNKVIYKGQIVKQ